MLKFKKLKIDSSFILLSLCLLLSKYQSYYLYLLLALIIHELGHLLIIYLKHIKYDSINLYSIGFIIEMSDNTLSFIDSILLYSFGIIFNLIGNIIPIIIFKTINNYLLLINLLIIFPLDGFQILNTLLSYFIPYKISLYLSLSLNLLILIILTIYLINYLDILLIINIIILFYYCFKQILNVNNIYESFLLSRYLYFNTFKIKYKNLDYNSTYRLYKFHKLKFKLSDKEIEEIDLLKLKYEKK